MSKGTLYDKTIDRHIVRGNQILIGKKVIHEVTSNPECMEKLVDEGLPLVHPETCFAVMDHILNTKSKDGRPFKDADDELMAKTLEDNVKRFNITYFPPGSGKGGVCHVVFPEQGLIWPGMTVICGDSHTSTYGAFGAIGFGVGSTQLGHALASQTYALDQRLKVRRINFTGELQKGVTAKDVVIHAIRRLGAKGGNGFAHEYGGEVIDRMSMEERLTMCNMGVEGGAKVAYINPDETTFEYLKDKPFAPKKDWDRAVKDWKAVASDKNAQYDDTVEINVSDLEPMFTWGNVSDQSVGISENIPTEIDQVTLDYMQLKEGQSLQGQQIDAVVIGSCTNGRLSDIAAVCEVWKGGEKVSVPTIVVPGSDLVRSQVEAEGYDKIIEAAGAQLRFAGCSACLSMSPDTFYNKERIVSTSNRDFKNRQGIGAKTHLASPYAAAASAIEGKITDPRKYLK